jgi:hypothetical protein
VSASDPPDPGDPTRYRLGLFALGGPIPPELVIVPPGAPVYTAIEAAAILHTYSGQLPPACEGCGHRWYTEASVPIPGAPPDHTVDVAGYCDCTCHTPAATPSQL